MISLSLFHNAKGEKVSPLNFRVMERIELNTRNFFIELSGNSAVSYVKVKLTGVDAGLDEDMGGIPIFTMMTKTPLSEMMGEKSKRDIARMVVQLYRDNSPDPMSEVLRDQVEKAEYFW